MITVARVIQEVAKTYGVTAEEILGAGQERRVAEPRHVAMYLCRQHIPRTTLMGLGRKFGRAHGTVGHSVENIAERRSSPLFDAALTRLEQALSNTPKPAFETEETAHVR